MLVVGKKASILSALHGIANCVKNGTRKIVSSNQYQRLARGSVAHAYFQSSLIIFLETKTQLWKLMWPISGCCIGSSGSPMHPPMLKQKFCLSRTVCEIYHFRLRFAFIKVYIFVQQNALDFLTLKRHNSLKIKQ